MKHSYFISYLNNFFKFSGPDYIYKTFNYSDHQTSTICCVFHIYIHVTEGESFYF